MREITVSELEAMKPSELETALDEQEQSLRDLAVAEGLGPSTSKDEFTTWANSTRQSRNIELLERALKERGPNISKDARHRFFGIGIAFVLIAIFMWFKSRA